MAAASDGVHSSVKAIQDLEAAVARFSRVLVDQLPEVERELRQITEQLEDRRGSLRSEIASLESTIASAGGDDDVSYEQRRLGDAEDELASATRQLRRLEDASAAYTTPARTIENLATGHTVKAKEFLTNAAQDLKAYLAASDDLKESPVFSRALASSSGKESPCLQGVPGAIDLMEKDDDFLIYASRRLDIDPDGFLDVVVHGTTNYILYDDLDLGPPELASIIKQNPQFCGQNIRLLSCSTGESQEGFAQKLANDLGVVVRAPNDLLWVLQDGSLVIGPTARKNTGSWINFLPKTNE